MNPKNIDWTAEVKTNPEMEYRALLRSLQRTRNFGLFFVQCSPAEGERIITRVREDIPQKRVEVLSLNESIDNLYDIVNSTLLNKGQIDILFIQGLEHSLYEYEKDRLWDDSGERYRYSETGVPRVLAHLNLSRERFRDNFNICLIFLVPLFALKYLIRRAPDFFDWRSGNLEFVMETDQLQQESSKVILENDYRKSLILTPQQRTQKILEIQALIEEEFQTPKQKAELLRQQGDILLSGNEFEAAVSCYNKAINFNKDSPKFWYSKGFALGKLGRYKERTECYEIAVKCNSFDVKDWYNCGAALYWLRRYEAAIYNFNKALKIQPDFHEALYGCGLTLEQMERYEEANDSFDRVLEIQPEHFWAWNSKARIFKKAWIAQLNIFVGMNLLEQMYISAAKAIQLQPNSKEAQELWNDSLNILYEDAITQGKKLLIGKNYKEAIKSFDEAIQLKHNSNEAWELFRAAKAIQLQPNSKEAWELWNDSLNILYKDAITQGRKLLIGKNYKEAIKSFDEAIQLKSNSKEAWELWNDSLNILYEDAITQGRKLLIGKNYKEAIKSFDEAIQLKPYSYETWIYKGDCFLYINFYSKAIESFEKAIENNPTLETAWIKKGNAFCQRNRYEDATLSFEKAISLNPESFEAWNSKGYALNQLRAYEEALLYFEKAIQLEPKSYKAWYGHGVALEKLGHHNEAKVSFENVQALHWRWHWE